MNKRQIAVAVAALFLGTQVGIAALEQETAHSSNAKPEVATAVLETADQHAAEYQAATSEYVEAAEQPSTELAATEAAETSAQPEAAEPSAAAETPVAEAQPARAEILAGAPTAAVEPAASAQPRAAADTTPAPAQPASWWQNLRAKIASLFERVRIVLASAIPAPVFPEGDDGKLWHSPAMLAYLDQVEQARAARYESEALAASSLPAGAGEPVQAARLQTAAYGDPFPAGSHEFLWMPPEQIAYFDRIERERLARESAIQTAQAGTDAAR